MQTIAVLSPHRDDAVFSLAHTLRYWSTRSVAPRVINIFTTSNYGPHAVSSTSRTVAELSALRKAEDRRALRRVAPAVLQHDLHLLDAPLAFDVGAMSVSGPKAILPDGQSVCKLAMLLGPLLRASLVLAPLGLGNHINHLMAKQAAVRCVPPARLAFYEDLPYADWATQQEWSVRLKEASRDGEVRLASSIMRSSHSVRWKRETVRLYRTQIDDREADLIASFGRRYGAGERLWFPRHSLAWRTVISRSLPLATALPRTAIPGPPIHRQV